MIHMMMNKRRRKSRKITGGGGGVERGERGERGGGVRVERLLAVAVAVYKENEVE
jgi:hypothetical protein